MAADWPAAQSLVPWLLLAAVPLLIASCTAFTKIGVVVAAIRVGLGAELLLPFAAMLALTVALTAVAMAPVGYEMFAVWQSLGDTVPVVADVSTLTALFEPLRAFMLRLADPVEVAFFSDLSALPAEHPAALVPGFLVSELTTGLMVAALILVPFVLVDLFVAQLLALCGVNLTNQAIVTLPVKILLFLGAGGWSLVLGNLVAGYVT